MSSGRLGQRLPLWMIPVSFLASMGITFSLHQYDVSGNNLWFILFAVCMAPCILMLLVLIANVHALPHTKRNGISVWQTALGILAGLAAAIFSGDLSDKEHDYIVNGVRMNDAVESIGMRIFVFFAAAALVIVLTMLLRGLAERLKYVSPGQALRALLLLLGIGGAAAGAAILTFQLTGAQAAVIPEADFLASPGSAKKGSIITFGQYPQNGTQKEPIEWQVFDKKDGLLWLVSQKALDSQHYHDNSHKHVRWQDATLRTWLNQTFVDAAFSPAERAMLVPISIAEGETDLASLMTEAQARRHYGKYAPCPASANTAAQETLSKAGDCEWWLRPSDSSDDRCYYYMLAELYTSHTSFYSFSFSSSTRGVRPVIVIRCEPAAK